MKRHKILYGVCGIGSGHTYRQLPIIENLAQNNLLVVFAYGASLQLYQKRFADNQNVHIIEVAVPYYVGNKTGLDFGASAELGARTGDTYVTTNAGAMDRASRILGKPDLVITDYEPVSAQYAYAYGVPLITIDQQSKYLCGSFPRELSGQGYEDEVMRLRMFFPLADTRIACSFFNVEPGPDKPVVMIVPPVLRPSVACLPASHEREERSVLVYLSGQAGFGQPLEELCGILAEQNEYTFHVFTTASGPEGVRVPRNVRLYPHGSPVFDEILAGCSGIIATAGHGLLSEAMHLGVPVYALPLPLYEQQMNAVVIGRNGFGMSASCLTGDGLADFLDRLPEFTKAIADDQSVLVRGDGTAEILAFIRNKLQANPKEE